MNHLVDTAPILLVEDSTSDVLLLKRAFRKAGVTRPVHVVSDGDTAVAYLSGDAPYDDRALHPFPSLVLLDLKLPRRSGFEVLSWVRAEPLLRTLPIIVLTSSSHEPDVDLAYQLGANAYLVKPVSAQSLQELVRTLEEHWFTFGRRPRGSSATGAP